MNQKRFEELEFNVNKALDKIREAFDEVADEVDIEDEVQPEQVLQGCIRGTNVLHLQFGVVGNYRKADVTLSAAQAKQLYDAGVHAKDCSCKYTLQASLAGSSTKYMIATDNGNGTFDIDGLTLKNPFYVAPAAAPTPANYVW